MGRSFLSSPGPHDAPNRRIPGGLIKAALGSGVAWFAFELANQIGSPRGASEYPIATVVFLAGSLAIAAYIAMRQQAGAAAGTEAYGSPAAGETRRADLLEAIEEISDAVVIADADGTIEYVNPAYTRMTGYSAAEVVGRNPRKDKSGMGPAIHNKVSAAIMARQTWRGEVANRRKDGSPCVEQVTVAPVWDDRGTLKKCVAVRRDMTAAKMDNQAKAFLASIVESSEDAIVSSTPEGLLVSWNRGAERLFGYSAEEILGQPASILAPADQRVTLKGISETLRRGESVGLCDAIGVRKDGRRIHVSISANPIRDAAGRITAGAAIIRDITARVEAHEARALLASIVDSADDAILGTAADGAILSWNVAAESMYGYPAAEILGRPASILFPIERIREVTAILDKINRGETVSQLETVTAGRDGVLIDVALTVSPVRNTAGAVVGSSIIARDIRRRKQDREALQQSEEKYRSLVANLPDMVWVADETCQPIFVSVNCQEMTGFTQEEICRPGIWTRRIHPDDLPGMLAAHRALFEEGQPVDTEYRFLRKDGHWIWLHSRASNTCQRYGKRCQDGLLSDVTERKRMEKKLAHQATHDMLTGLPNRALFEYRFGQTLAQSRRSGTAAALLYVDLDRFKRVNDTLGYMAGDQLIQLAAARLEKCLRESETLSRSGGDGFMLVLGEIREREEAIHVAHRMMQALSQPFTVRGNEIFLSASIGIAIYPHDGDNLIDLQRAADGALHAAKRQGNRRVQMSTPELGQAAGRRLALETELHYALERGELSLAYQPQFELSTNRIVGVEALARWSNPKFGYVPASVMIPIAEESGLIVPIGAYVMREACRQGKSWEQSGRDPIQMAVNTSSVQFARGLTKLVSEVLEETGLEPHRLDLELTESVIMQDIQESARQLRQLKQLGVSVSLDDFGTGYSSLSYLEELPIDNLKIDRKFVQRMKGDEGTSTLVESIVDLAHSLGMRAVAEGVETKEQLSQLKAMGCDRAQSFMLGAPAPARSIQQLLARAS